MIKFGTDGWRAIISEDYTFNNVRLVAEAVADYVIEKGEADKGIVVGYDARFLSEEYAADCAAVVASKGIKTWLANEFLPTPALTWQVVDRNSACGIMITASHNPAAYNGFKIKAAYGGSASPEIIADVEKYIRKLEASGRTFPKLVSEEVEKYSPIEAYLNHVRALLDKNTLRAFKGKIIFDCMHGSAQGYAKLLAEEYGLDLIEIRGDYNPSFGRTNPEPIEKNLTPLKEAIVKHQAAVGLATDGDGDRIGAMDADGRFISANQIMALLIKYFVEKRGWSGGVVKTITVSELVAKTAQKYGRKVYETPVGFKYVANLMISDDILIGGEESGGIGLKNYIPERDGVMLGYLLIEIVAAYNKTLGQLLDEMMDELGHFHYRREDLHIENDRKERLMNGLVNQTPSEFNGDAVIKSDVRDGCKLYLADGWLIFRASGTEPIVRIYAEFPTVERVEEVLRNAISYAKNA